MQGPLGGAGVLITRPARQAAGFARKVAAIGGAPIVFPAIVILPPDDAAPLARAHAELGRYDVALFVSANAVEYGAPDASRWPSTLATFAPGPGTAEALAAIGIEARIPGTTLDSEGLLALPELRDMRGRRVVVFRGEGGRDLLVDTLRERGAVVDTIACYRRAAPSQARGLDEAFGEARVDAVTVTSSEGFDNLWRIASQSSRDAWARVPTFAPHPRIAEHVRAQRLDAVETGGGDAGLIAGLLEWFAAHPRHDKN
jgi:uroporphyrinogen-III synthase